MRPRLTPHQRDIFEQVVRKHEAVIQRRKEAGITNGRTPSFTGRPSPQRLFVATVAANITTPYVVGSTGALAHLAQKGYLHVAVDDTICPIYTLNEDTDG